MATHGTERAFQARMDFQRTEIMGLCERVLVLERRLAQLADEVDAMLTKQHGMAQSDPE